MGDAEEEDGNGDQKRNARKRKHASKDQESKQDNEEGEKSNGDKKPKAAAKKKVLETVITVLMPMAVRTHIIELFQLQQEATFQTANDVLMEHTQDSSINMSSAIQMPSSNALQVVRIWVYLKNSCGVNRVKSINISNSITSLNL